MGCATSLTTAIQADASLASSSLSQWKVVGLASLGADFPDQGSCVQSLRAQHVSSSVSATQNMTRPVVGAQNLTGQCFPAQSFAKVPGFNTDHYEQTLSAQNLMVPNLAAQQLAVQGLMAPNITPIPPLPANMFRNSDQLSQASTITSDRGILSKASYSAVTSVSNGQVTSAIQDTFPPTVSSLPFSASASEWRITGITVPLSDDSGACLAVPVATESVLNMNQEHLASSAQAIIPQSTQLSQTMFSPVCPSAMAAGTLVKQESIGASPHAFSQHSEVFSPVYSSAVFSQAVPQPALSSISPQSQPTFSMQSPSAQSQPQSQFVLSSISTQPAFSTQSPSTVLARPFQLTTCHQTASSQAVFSQAYLPGPQAAISQASPLISGMESGAESMEWQVVGVTSIGSSEYIAFLHQICFSFFMLYNMGTGKKGGWVV
jgi:hypothetical protein